MKTIYLLISKDNKNKVAKIELSKKQLSILKENNDDTFIPFSKITKLINKKPINVDGLVE